MLYTRNELRSEVSLIDCLIHCDFGCQNSNWRVLGNKGLKYKVMLVLMDIFSELK